MELLVMGTYISEVHTQKKKRLKSDSPSTPTSTWHQKTEDQPPIFLSHNPTRLNPVTFLPHLPFLGL